MDADVCDDECGIRDSVQRSSLGSACDWFRNVRGLGFWSMLLDFSGLGGLIEILAIDYGQG